MPSLSDYRRILARGGPTIGSSVKAHSDLVMEATWDSDIASKTCYIYDYFHDDMARLSKGMTYENTTKTKISAKFLVKSYTSISKDQVEYYLQFKPSEKLTFEPGDELCYYQRYFADRYKAEFPVGMYVDIPDERGVYRKWLICEAGDFGSQFIKYLILPCNYEMQWIEQNGSKRIKRQMWCVLRSQNS